METVPDFAVFVTVIETGSFSMAATRLNVTKSAVSRRVTVLEKRLGIQLLQRSTRKLVLTEAGSRYLAHAREALHHVQTAEREAAQYGEEAIGEIRLLAPMSFGTRHIAPWLPEFLALHPRLSVDLSLDDRTVAPIEGGYDIALRTGDLADSTQITRKLAPLHSVICASSNYVRQYGAPQSPADLTTRNCILYSYSDNREFWNFRSALGPERIHVSGNLSVNNSEALCAMLVAGSGIGRLPTFIANNLIAQGNLVQLLPEFIMPSKMLYAVFPSRKLISRATRYLIDFLVEKFDPERPYWDRAIELDRPDANSFLNSTTTSDDQ